MQEHHFEEQDWGGTSSFSNGSSEVSSWSMGLFNPSIGRIRMAMSAETLQAVAGVVAE
ncbi:hypothetical protein FA13DRAFT_1735460 [Coprinellus micaceus]|uniref:Uncharacterized protein n=1 Tax=Coprinellus micaceus TaxID=71717 RepID=A0A4Y7T3P0_COPMI|nr:hypothetical protein FA13DRAFT_1735460 [Coprinellus micaceus]